MRRMNSTNLMTQVGRQKSRNLLFGSRFFLISAAFTVVQIVLFSWHCDQQRRIETIQEVTIAKSFNNASKWTEDYKVVLNYNGTAYNKLSKQGKRDVTLVTQCSVNNLHYLPIIARRWTGPMSVAIFTAKYDAVHAILAVKWLKHCYPRSLGTRTQFHLVFPTKYPPQPRLDSIAPNIWKNNHLNSHKLSLDCRTAMKAIQAIEGTNYMAHGVPYPHNTLRNVAKRAVETKFMFLIDIDTIPGVGIREQFLKFYNRLDDVTKLNTVFVTPAFEIRSGINIPKIKRELLEQYTLENVRPFHHETCIWCHKPTRFSDWLDIAISDGLEVAYEGDWEPSWEPFYISTTTIPDYDERFKQYGYDRISQVCELSMAEYKFLILNNAFVVHEGYKFPGKFHSQKDVENKRNFKIYTEIFTPEMKSKYPNSTTSCQERNRVRGRAQVKFKPHFEAHLKKKHIDLKSTQEL